jgi:mannose-6-phosphate isomerase-like protein (cupin superfamily)
MLIRRLKECAEIVAGDGTRLRELLHPDRDYPFMGRYPFRGRYSLAHAILPPGQCAKPHRLTSSEVYYIMSGEGVLHIGDDSQVLQPGDAVEIPPGETQWLENRSTTDLCFLCIVDPAWRAEDEELL